MKVDNSLIEKLETLAYLQLDDVEKAQLIKDLDKMIDMFGKISEVETEGVIPLSHMTDSVNVMRADTPSNGLSVEDALENAPEQVGRYFAVPKVIE
jgi:aspartyl-tRNA(Asn)/glutamyl-tRNA(Gln) amidotransferase subunit C